MDNDWATLTDERKRALVQSLLSLGDTYFRMNQALEQFLDDTAETILTKRGEINTIIDGLQNAKPREVSNNESEELRVEKLDDGGLRLHLPPEYERVLKTTMSNYAELYEKHKQMRCDMAFIYAFTLFDGLVADTIQTLLIQVPGRLKLSSRQISYEHALAFPTREALISDLARREVVDVTRRSAIDQLEYFKKNYHVDPLSAAGIVANVLMVAAEQRNLLVHNNGVVTTEYVQKTHANIPIGAQLKLDEMEMRSHLSALRSIGLALVNELIGKFAPDDWTGVRVVWPEGEHEL